MLLLWEHAEGWLVPPLVLKDNMEEKVWGKAGLMYSRFAVTCRTSMQRQMDEGRSENKSSIKKEKWREGVCNTVFIMGQHSFVTSRDVMLNKPQSTYFFSFFFLLKHFKSDGKNFRL